jgi:hypothetical protein
MKTRPFALLGVVFLAIAGCRTNPAITLLERDNFQKEQEIYRLRAQLEDLQDSSSCGHRPERDARSGRDDDRDEPAPRHRPSSTAPSGDQGPKIDVEIPGQPSEKIPDTLRRRGTSPTTSIPESDGPSLDQSAERTTVRTIAGEASMSTPRHTREPAPFMPSGDSRRVAAIAIDRGLSGGINSDGSAGDQALLVVVQPRDRRGQTVDAPADISVVALDPAILDSRGKAARVGRWDFTAAETASLFRRTDSRGAVHLAMAWPADPPKHGTLHLFVRYTTADGRRVETDGPVEVVLAAQRQAGWAPAPRSARGGHAADEGELSRRGGPELGSPAESWQPNETPSPRAAEPPPEMATRTDPRRPERPAWSPERR